MAYCTKTSHLIPVLSDVNFTQVWLIFIRNHPNPVFMFLDCRMENSETNPPSRPLAVPDRAMLRPSAPLGQMSESPRASKHREHSSKSPRKRRDGKRSQRRGGDHEQLLWEIERRRLPGQHEHLEPCSSASDTAESSPKRFALQVASWSFVPLAQLCCLGREVMFSWLHCLSFSQKSPLSTWTVSSHSLRTQSLHSSQPNFSHVSMRVLNESDFVFVRTLTQMSLCNWMR